MIEGVSVYWAHPLFVYGFFFWGAVGDVGCFFLT